MEAHEIIKQVQESFRSVVGQLARLTGKTAEWFHSHGREPRSQNPLQSGNASPVTHYLQYVRQYEASERGAGKMLNRRIYEELEMEFSGDGEIQRCQKELHAGVLKESFDVLRDLNEQDFLNCSTHQLAAMEEEGAQLRDKASDYVSHLRAIRRIKKGFQD